VTAQVLSLVPDIMGEIKKGRVFSLDLNYYPSGKLCMKTVNCLK